MKVISLQQPWATLVVIGAKKIETRSWATKYRGDILIHASRNMNKAQKELARSEPFWQYLKDMEELPLGAIVGKVEIMDLYKTAGSANGSITVNQAARAKLKSVKWETEKQFGDYTPNRYCWVLTNPVSFSHHIPFTGSLGLWDFDERICLSCGCTDNDCRHCIEKIGQPCHWAGDNICSACLKNGIGQ